MFPIRARIAYRSNKDWRGASLEEQSTETVDHFGVRKEEIGSQCRVVPSMGSVARDVGESWRKTIQKGKCRGQDETEVILLNSGIVPNGDRIIRRRFPREVVISLSSSCPTQVKSRSARSKPISSHVCRIAERRRVSYKISRNGGAAHRCNNRLRRLPRFYLLGKQHGPRTTC